MRNAERSVGEEAMEEAWEKRNVPVRKAMSCRYVNALRVCKLVYIHKDNIERCLHIYIYIYLYIYKRLNNKI